MVQGTVHGGVSVSTADLILRLFRWCPFLGGAFGKGLRASGENSLDIVTSGLRAVDVEAICSVFAGSLTFLLQMNELPAGVFVELIAASSLSGRILLEGAFEYSPPLSPIFSDVSGAAAGLEIMVFGLLLDVDAVPEVDESSPSCLLVCTSMNCTLVSTSDAELIIGLVSFSLEFNLTCGCFLSICFLKLLEEDL
ncbi:unnamed protein product [Acanthoscelides obtectus]|uniref:Uncharacterized protein n=1 Tax=Acanthoscelides obtectus TaxID=200917 RepID=A0A9P0JPK5_ACAOB|nr:unnamed protein product [Acanthoscelides obtectus]CAK1671252.1 hypothetical protein AOBTE_LOCUS28187 [Acanthoscelides obtectus]